MSTATTDTLVFKVEKKEATSDCAKVTLQTIPPDAEAGINQTLMSKSSSFMILQFNTEDEAAFLRVDQCYELTLKPFTCPTPAVEDAN